MKQITSRDNAYFKGLLRLVESGRERRQERRIVLEGLHLVECYARQFGSSDAQIILRHSACERSDLRQYADLQSSVVLSDALFDELAPVQTPVGVMAIVPLPERKSFGTIEPELVIFLDGIQDPGNLGSILRSACAAGAGSAVLSSKCADPWSPRGLRGGMGAQFFIDVHTHADLETEARAFSGRLIACGAGAQTLLYDSDLTGNVAIMLGGEGAGLSTGLLELAHKLVRVPMRSEIESLNVAAVAAVVLFERRRQIWASP